MIKQDIITEVVEETGLSEFDVRQTFDSIITVMTKALQNGEEIVIRGFGAFKFKTRAPRTARDFRTGQPISMPGRDIIVFEPGSDLK